MSDKGINLPDDILRVINEKVNPSCLDESCYDLARLRLTILGFVQCLCGAQRVKAPFEQDGGVRNGYLC